MAIATASSGVLELARLTRRFSRRGTMWLACVLLVSWTVPVDAQQRPGQAPAPARQPVTRAVPPQRGAQPKAAQPARRPRRTPKKPLPAPEEVVQRTNEPGGVSVELHATFYPSDKGKDAVTVVLLHGYKGSRVDYAPLVALLREKERAVLVPDLRGHGDSRRAVRLAGNRLVNISLDAEKFAPADFARMVQYDMETWKKFLLQKNDAEELNIEKLCVVGADMGAAVALDWARLDWSWPQYPGLKQGQDVKALVLLSPPMSFRGLDLRRALAHPQVRNALSIMIIVGKEDSRSMADADRVYKMLERARTYLTDDTPPHLRTLFLGALPTSLQGTKLLGVPELKVAGAIEWFINLRLAKQEMPWQKRSKD